MGYCYVLRFLIGDRVDVYEFYSDKLADEATFKRWYPGFMACKGHTIRVSEETFVRMCMKLDAKTPVISGDTLGQEYEAYYGDSTAPYQELTAVPLHALPEGGCREFDTIKELRDIECTSYSGKTKKVPLALCESLSNHRSEFEGITDVDEAVAMIEDLVFRIETRLWDIPKELYNLNVQNFPTECMRAHPKIISAFARWQVKTEARWKEKYGCEPTKIGEVTITSAYRRLGTDIKKGLPAPDRYGVRDAWYRHAHWNGLAIDVTPTGPTQRYWVTWTPPLDEDDVWPTPGSTSEAASTLEEAGMDRPWPKDDAPHIVLADQSMVFP